MTANAVHIERLRHQRAARERQEETRRHEEAKTRSSGQEALSPSPASSPSPRPKELQVIPLFDDNGKPRRQGDILIDLGKKHRLFHNKDGTAYARDGVAVYPIESPSYKEKLMHLYLNLTGKGASRTSMRDALDTLSSLAKFDGPERNVWLRTGYNGKKNIVIDLGRPDWQMLEIRADGYSHSDRAPNFQRSQAMMALPQPGEADFKRIWRYLNVRLEDRPLVAAWLLAAVRPSGPYPILILSGEQGTGKTSAARFLRRLVDPSASPVRAPPKDIRDLLVGAKNSWVLSLDNLSTLTPELSDALCRLSTGGAIAERALYTNTDEVLVEVQRPVIINGIEDLASRPDLSERSLHIELVPIGKRKTEEDLNRQFAQDWPHIVGGLFEAASAALRDCGTIHIDDLPRMADFTKWACAGVPALGYSTDAFLAAFRSNLADGMISSVENSPVGRVLMDFIRKRGQWQGTSTELLSQLGSSPGADQRSLAWPKSPKGLSGVLKRLAPALRATGVQIDEGRTAAARIIHLRYRPD